MKAYIIIFLSFWISFSAKTQDKASTVISSMGTGFNLGNTFDYELHETTPKSIQPIIDLYYEAGMRHIRIPVTWMDGFKGNTLADTNGNINFDHPRFIQLQAVIDYAIQKNMYVTLNAHHENWIYKHYGNSKKYDAAFANLWNHIASHFKNYPQLLIFEILNEPQGNFGDWTGNTKPDDAYGLALTRQVNKTGYQAIRKTGGLNQTRVIMVSTNAWGNHMQLSKVYPIKDSLPAKGQDPYLAVQLHTYDPWTFCGQTGSNSAYPGSKTIETSIRKVAAHARLLCIPVNYGEFGVGRDINKAERNTDSVREFYRTIRLTTLSEKMSNTAWDDRGWFGLTQSDNMGNYNFVDNIVPSMMAP